jgi:hypothetical protein
MKKYTHQTIVVPVEGKTWSHEVRAQDGSCPVTLHSGTYDECKKWQDENCSGPKY